MNADTLRDMDRETIDALESYKGATGVNAQMYMCRAVSSATAALNEARRTNASAETQAMLAQRLGVVLYGAGDLNRATAVLAGALRIPGLSGVDRVVFRNLLDLVDLARVTGGGGEP